MKDIPLWLKYASAIAGIFALVWGCFVYFAPQFPLILGTRDQTLVLSASVRANAISIEDILYRQASKSTSLEKQEFIGNYENSRVYGVGLFADIAKSGDSYLVSIHIAKDELDCQFPNKPDTERRLLLVRQGQSIGFTGVFMNKVLSDGAWYIQDCTLETI